MIEKIVEGKLDSFYEQVVPARPAVACATRTVKVAQMIAQAVAKTGENITVGRFARFKLGRGGRVTPRTSSTEPKSEDAASPPTPFFVLRSQSPLTVLPASVLDL